MHATIIIENIKQKTSANAANVCFSEPQAHTHGMLSFKRVMPLEKLAKQETKWS